MNFAGIVGPALGSLLLPIVGPPVIFALNALAFLSVAWVIFRVYHAQRRPNPHLENFLEPFASALRYVQYKLGIQVILTRDFFIRAFHRGGSRASASCRICSLLGSQLGFVFTAMGIGSLLGAALLLPYGRAKATPNLLTILAGALLVAVLVLMAIAQNLWVFLPVAALAGASWTVSASELWIAGQQAMPDWARGRRADERASHGGLARRSSARRSLLERGRGFLGS
jgi:Transmembrane secretion effector